ncbi:MAG: nucleotide exchange factor GrpE [Rhodospirillaceae bacterium]|nr:nucleotide exchange factor GrpE [Rhodospirillaceae bacterium]|tara:strand:- start:759 stop:1424 length:666 start_codon:yes stop_codon:yes gene_type:complete
MTDKSKKRDTLSLKEKFLDAESQATRSDEIPHESENAVLGSDSVSPHEASTPEDLERIKELEVALEDAKKEKLLAQAESVNVGKRADKRISENSKFATADLCKSLLQVADNLERALLAAPEELRKENEVVSNLAIGVDMTAKELINILSSYGVQKITSLGAVFDPNQHQAIQKVERDGVANGIIVEVMQEGYMVHDRLLREAMVVVASTATNGGPDNSEDE